MMPAPHALVEIDDPLHAGLLHRVPRGSERAGQIDRPAAGLYDDGIEA